MLIGDDQKQRSRRQGRPADGQTGQIMLTNCGHRAALGWLAVASPDAFPPRSDERLLCDLSRAGLVPCRGTKREHELLELGLIQLAPAGMSNREAKLRYKRNPLEHVSRVVFEFTTRCNFRCSHCYNARVPRATERDIELLKDVGTLFFGIGVRQFAFIGGEVSKYGDGWLDLAQHLRGLGEDVYVALLTNGWWLGQRNFQAAGRRYEDLKEFLADLKANGLTHLIFSIDGPEAVHDASRGHPGLYRRILDGFDAVRTVGISPHVAPLLEQKSVESGEAQAGFLTEIAERLYHFSKRTSRATKLRRLMEDPGTVSSNLIDIGNGASSRTAEFRLDETVPESLRCKGFFRPGPVLTVKASGEISTCRVTSAGEGYGNIHERNPVEILNSLQEQPVFRLHAERRIGDYLQYVDRSVFGDAFRHGCALRAIVTMIARRMEELAVDPGDPAAVLAINHEVAKRTGHLA